jgi:hypothetical protein
MLSSVPTWVFAVEDVREGAVRAEIAVEAESRSAAYRYLRSLGLHKKQFLGHGYMVGPNDDVPNAKPGELLRRRDDGHGSWSAWSPVTDADPLNWQDDPSSPSGTSVIH